LKCRFYNTTVSFVDRIPEIIASAGFHVVRVDQRGSLTAQQSGLPAWFQVSYGTDKIVLACGAGALPHLNSPDRSRAHLYVLFNRPIVTLPQLAIRNILEIAFGLTAGSEHMARHVISVLKSAAGPDDLVAG
jgi:hypothetical protein